MKKTFKILVCASLCVFLSACSKQNDDYILTFFDALDKTLQIDSGHIDGKLTIETDSPASMNFDLYLDQTDKIQLALNVTGESDSVKNQEIAQFYIKDGKTYLNYLGTTSQSVAENIGIDSDEKLSVSNPFLSYSDDELKEIFTSSKKNGDTYTFKIDKDKLESFLDAYGSMTIDSANIETTIQDGYFSTFKLTVKGFQTINDEKANIDVTINCTFEEINSLDSITFPDNLDTY